MILELRRNQYYIPYLSLHEVQDSPLKYIIQTYGLELYPLCNSDGLSMHISGIQHFSYAIKICILN